MSHQTNTQTDPRDLQPQNYQTLSIRDELEKLAWLQNPGLARRLSDRSSRSKRRPQFIRWQDRILLSLAAVLMTLFFIRTVSADTDEQQWGLQLKNSLGQYTQLAVNTDIQVDITGLIARVEVTQKFSNHSNQWAEGIYRYPLPQGAAVDRMYIKVGERILEGEIQEKETARRVYEKARDNGQTATLVEQQRRNQFETRLANIGPGEAIEITIGLPATPIPEPVLAPSSSSNDHGLTLQANLISTFEFAAIESRYHDVDIRQVDSGYRIELLDPYAITDRDFDLSW